MARTALVTGVAGDLGGYLARDLQSRGWTVCGIDRRVPESPPAEGLTLELGDLGDPDEAERAVGALHDAVGAFDAVINCACMIANAPIMTFERGRLVHHDFELWQRVVSSCLSSAFYVTACTVPRMVSARKRGVVVNISSVTSRGNPGQSAYSAAKAGLNGLTAALAKELGPLGIRVAAVAPGYIDTESTRTHVPGAKLEEIVGAVPLRRLGGVADVAAAVAFVLDNDYVNGALIPVDGGLVV